MPAHEPISRRSFSGRLQPISVPYPLPILPNRVWSDEDWQRIQCGRLSRDMDEKWDIFAEGDTVFLHRSWTGNGVFAATFGPVGGGWRIAEALVERDPKRYRVADDDYDCVLLELVLSDYLLGGCSEELRVRFRELISQMAANEGTSAAPVQPAAQAERSES